MADPHYQAREMLVSAQLPDGTDVKMPGITPKLSDTPGRVRWNGPVLGEHTADVLESLGRSAEDIADLKRRRVVQ